MFYSKKLKKIKALKHCFFSRKNGFSKGLYRSLNCGRGSLDDNKNLQKNLNFVAKKMGVKKNKLILMHQTHSNKVVEISKKNLNKIIKADAIITKMRGVALGVVTADCAPIILCDINNQIVGCIHAGWRGAYSDIIKNTIIKIKKINPNALIYACIGPCINKKNYEVDLTFYKKFIKKSKSFRKYFSKKNNQKKNFNLREYVADKLKEFKIKIDHIDKDTYSEESNFFSYRRARKLEEKDYGRCISAISMP
tara:strand:- start:1784 stop:2536 length:753 start_codon:yes stop_codon:yes gene_type:complete